MAVNVIGVLTGVVGRLRGGGPMPVDTDVIGLLETFEAVSRADMQGLWDQGDWVRAADDDRKFCLDGRTFCGTAGCFAGWRALLDGGVRSIDGEGDPCVVFPGGEVVASSQIGHWARERLGLSRDQAGVLFEATNTLDELRQAIIAIIEGDEAWEEWEGRWWERRAVSPEDRLLGHLEQLEPV